MSVSTGCSIPYRVQTMGEYSVEKKDRSGITFNYFPDEVDDVSIFDHKAQKHCQQFGERAELFGAGYIYFTGGMYNRIYKCVTETELREMSKKPEFDYSLSTIDSLPQKPIRRIYQRRRDNKYIVADIAALKNIPYNIYLEIFNRFYDDKWTPEVTGIMRGVASNPQLTKKLAVKLAKEKDHLVSRDLINNPATPVSVLKMIRNYAQKEELGIRSTQLERKAEQAIKDKRE